MSLSILMAAILLTNSPLFHADDVYVSSGEVKFYANKSLFFVSDSLDRADIYYMLDGSSIGDTGVVTYKLTLELKDRAGSKKPIKSEQTIRTHISSENPFMIDMFTLFLQPGDYDLTMKIEAGQKLSGAVKMMLHTPSMPDTLCLSDIELIWSTGTDTNSIFSRYGLKLVPNPLDAYFPGHDTLIYLFEVNNLVPDTGKYVVTAVIEDADGKVYKSIRPQVKDKDGGQTAVVLGGADLNGLLTGRYRLRVQVTDLSSMKSAYGVREFVYSYGAVVQADTEILNYAGFIEYFASPDEMDQYRDMPDQGKILFLKKFWHRHGFTIPEIVERVKYADEHFSIGKKKGRFTDRGRIYIKYGPPDEIERSGIQMKDMDKETWFYYRGRGLEFVFVDIDGTGDYKLVYSNAQDEPSMPNWRDYLSPGDIQGGEW